MLALAFIHVGLLYGGVYAEKPTTRRNFRILFAVVLIASIGLTLSGIHPNMRD